MPELPEVETTIRYIKPHLLEQVITDLRVTDKGRSHFNVSLGELEEKLVGATLLQLARIGKWMLFTFDKHGQKSNWVGHLRMSGRYLVSDDPVEHVHNRFRLATSAGKNLNYIDQRRFGTFHLVDSFETHPALSTIGPDALSSDFNPTYLKKVLTGRKKPIYTALLDQRIVAGLGNIYVNEILFATKIDPRRPAGELTDAELICIVDETMRILQASLELKGTTLIDNLYQDPEGKTGEFAKILQVYGKKQDPEIEVIKIGGRSVFVHSSQK